MPFRLPGTLPHTDVRVLPYEIVEAGYRTKQYVENLHIGQGVVEFIDTTLLDSVEANIHALNMGGLNDIAIAAILGYTEKEVTTHQADIQEKLEARNRPHAVAQSFDKRIVRVTAPLPSPALNDSELRLLYPVSQGLEDRQISEQYGLLYNSVRDIIAGMRQKVEAKNRSRLVATGYLSRLLRRQVLPTESTVRLHDQSITLSRQNRDDGQPFDQSPIDYIEWHGGVFAFHKDPLLKPRQQLLLGLLACGLQRRDIVRLTGYCETKYRSILSATCEDLDAKNTAHALTKAFDSDKARITRPIRAVYLNDAEIDVLDLVASGVPIRAIGPSLGKWDTYGSKIMHSVRKKTGTYSNEAAVMARYMSGKLDLDKLTDTYAA